MQFNIKTLMLIPAWVAALFGTLQIHKANFHLDHPFCGAWGCTPKFEGLVGYHAFWMVAMLPVAIFLSNLVSSELRRRVGWGVFLGGLAAALFYAIIDGVGYFAASHAVLQIIPRAMYAIVIAVDLPMLQLAFAGLCVWFLNRDHSSADEPSPSAGDAGE